MKLNEIEENYFQKQVRSTVKKKLYIEVAMKIAILLIMMAAACSCVTSLDLQKAFTEHEVIPDIMKVAPKKILQVSSIEIHRSELSSESFIFR